MMHTHIMYTVCIISHAFFAVTVQSTGIKDVVPREDENYGDT